MRALDLVDGFANPSVSPPIRQRAPSPGLPAGGRCTTLSLLPFVFSSSPTQVTVDEGVEVAVEDTLDVSHLDVGAKILHHLIRLHHIAADLAAPGRFTLFAPNLIDVGQALHPR